VQAIPTTFYSLFLGAPPRTFAVVGIGMSEGKTLTAMLFVIAVALRGRRCLIVDTDLRRGRLHRLCGVPRSGGLYETVMGKVELGQAIRSTAFAGVDVLVTGEMPEKLSPARLLESAEFRKIVETVRERYDLVVFDTPPLSLVGDAQIIGSHCDCVVPVARFQKTRRRGVRRLIDQLARSGVQVPGFIITDVDLRSVEYGYYYSRAYGYKHKYGYGYGGSQG
jgi:tyrosine-protein kinase Etk/Wzc